MSQQVVCSVDIIELTESVSRTDGADSSSAEAESLFGVAILAESMSRNGGANSSSANAENLFRVAMPVVSSGITERVTASADSLSTLPMLCLLLGHAEAR